MAMFGWECFLGSLACVHRQHGVLPASNELQWCPLSNICKVTVLTCSGKISAISWWIIQVFLMGLVQSPQSNQAMPWGVYPIRFILTDEQNIPNSSLEISCWKSYLFTMQSYKNSPNASTTLFHWWLVKIPFYMISLHNVWLVTNNL